MEKNENKLNKKIFFQKCSFNNIYFLFYILVAIGELLIKYKTHPYLWKEKGLNKKDYYLANQLLFLYISNFADFLAIIPYLIMKKLSKEKKEIKEEEEEKNEKLLIENNDTNENHEINEAYELIYNERSSIHNKTRKNLIFIYTIILSILDFLGDFTLVLFYIIFKDKDTYICEFNSTVPLDIICQFVSSYFILKIHFYKLHYFCFILYFIVFIIILIIDLINIFYLKTFEGYLYLFYPFSLIFFSIEYAFGKKVILYGYISIYLLILKRGIIKLFLSIIVTIFMLLFKREDLIRIGLCLNSTEKILFNIGYIIAEFLESIFLWIIIDRFSPNHIPLVIIMKEISEFAVEKILYIDDDHTKEGWDLYVRLFLYLILFIGVLLHNQIIVINICGLASDTKYFLDLKLESEQLYSNTDNPEILQRYETQVGNEIQIEDEEEERNENQDGDKNEIMDENQDKDKNGDLNRDIDKKIKEDKIENKDEENIDTIYRVDESSIN